MRYFRCFLLGMAGGGMLLWSFLPCRAQNAPPIRAGGSGQTSTSSGLILHPAGPATSVSFHSFGSPFSTPQIGGFLDPDHSHLMQMLMRADAASALSLTETQRLALENLKIKGASEIKQQAADAARRIDALNANPDNLSESERLAQARKVIGEIQEERRTQENEANQRALALLNTAQIRRLTELDLQWRGLMALADSSLTDALQLTDTQQAIVSDGVEVFLKAQQGALKAAEVSLRPPPPLKPDEATARVENRRGAVEVRSSMTQLTMQNVRERDARLIEALKPVQKTRAESENKIMAALTPVQRQQWKALQGRPFAFRPNL